MAKLKNYKIAVLILAVVIILFTIFGLHRSLGSQVKEVEDRFYDGVEYDGYVHPSINSQLEKRYSSALGIQAFASTYSLDKQVETLRSACNEYKAAKSISEKYKANAGMQKAFDDLCSLLEEKDLSQRDSDAISDYISTFSNAQKTIDTSGYNESVREFDRNVLNVFPVNFLRFLAFIQSPELFE